MSDMAGPDTTGRRLHLEPLSLGCVSKLHTRTFVPLSTIHNTSTPLGTPDDLQAPRYINQQTRETYDTYHEGDHLDEEEEILKHALQGIH